MILNLKKFEFEKEKCLHGVWYVDRNKTSGARNPAVPALGAVFEVLLIFFRNL